ncbi:hypothetical protein GCM10009753_06840 [Streptantibioticus ferralitis]
MSPQRPRDAPQLCSDSRSEETPRTAPAPMAAARNGKMRAPAMGGGWEISVPGTATGPEAASRSGEIAGTGNGGKARKTDPLVWGGAGNP